MIALCRDHHPEADAGAYTREQLHAFKRRAQDRIPDVRGRFSWMRNELVTYVGGVQVVDHGSRVLVLYNERPVIWYDRDPDGYLLLNIRMITLSGEPRLRLEDNFWTIKGAPTDFECPPSGKSIKVKYANGDALEVNFREEDFRGRRVTAVEILMEVVGAGISLRRRHLAARGLSMTGCTAENTGGLALAGPSEDLVIRFVKDQVFNAGEVILEKVYMERCTFGQGCTVVYTGKGFVTLLDCRFSGNSWAFRGPAGDVVDFLRMIYQGSSDGKRRVLELLERPAN
jgi:hypothetical protein